MSDGEWGNEQLNERLVVAYERLATAMEGLHEEVKKAGARYWPPRREQREAIVTRIETDEEREKKKQGSMLRTIMDAIDPNADEQLEEETIGARTRQWLKDHPKEESQKP